MRCRLVVAITSLLLGCATPTFARKLLYGGPAAIDDTRSLYDAITASRKVGRPLHIVFVHGIRAEGPGESGDFTARLAKALGTSVDGPPQRIDIDLGRRPVAASVIGSTLGDTTGETPIWRDDAEWARSMPFIERSTIHATAGDVVIDEVNYWPLLFPLKCRFLLAPEHDLSGNDVEHLKLCSDWLDKEQLDNMLHSKPRSGGGATINAVLKHQIMNWGLSDAVIALGPMRLYLNATMDRAFKAALDGAPEDQDYVIVAESLGSFVVLDAYGAGQPNVAHVLDRTADLYFMANQFALLELARIDGLPAKLGTSQRDLVFAQPQPSPLRALQSWASAGHDRALVGVPGRPRQIVAFSDPSDLLTYRVPPLKDVTVVNVYDRNPAVILGLFANPITAHTGHIDNPNVWRLLMRSRKTH